MAQRLLVSDGSNAREVLDPTGYLVSSLGFVRQIDEAYCVLDGIVRQYWPPASTSSDPNILWPMQGLKVTNFELIANQPSISAITLDPDGSYLHSDDTDEFTPGFGGGSWLGITVTGTGQYLIRADVVSGTPNVGDSLGVWLDAFTARTFGVSLATQGVLETIINISVAAGSVTPDAGTEVVRQITFDTHVVGTSLIGWTQEPWFIDTFTNMGGFASTDLFFEPNGTARGFGLTSGEITEDWHNDAPSPADPSLFTVTAVLFSGDTPTGILGSPITLDNAAQWTLTAAEGESLICELDVTVGDGTETVTKRVRLQSSSILITQNVWGTDPINIIGTTIAPQETVAELIFKVDGTFEADVTLGTNVNEDWHSEAPAASDPSNYEVFIDLVSTSNISITGDTLEQWLNLSIQRSFTFTLEVIPQLPQDTASVSLIAMVRRVGQPSDDRVFDIQLNYESGA